MRQDSNGIWVLDQNFGYIKIGGVTVNQVIGGKSQDVSTGTVSIHKIMFKKKGSKSNSDAYSYEIVKNK
jgi:hypothetical protein